VKFQELLAHDGFPLPCPADRIKTVKGLKIWNMETKMETAY